jgi:putative thioredoxin
MKLFYFTASWCQPCKVFGPIMESIGKDYTVDKIDIEQDMNTATLLDVRSIPTVVIFERDTGTELGRFTGARTEGWVRDFLKEAEA